MLLLEDFYIIQSAEILHDYLNVPLKNDSSMMTAARRKYIQCLSTSCVICRHVTILSKTFRTNGENHLKVFLLLNYMLHVLHKLPHYRRRKAYCLSQMIKRSFQHTAFFLSIRRRPKMFICCALYRNLNLHPTTTLFPKVSRGPIVAHSPLRELKTSHISKFSCS